MRIRASVLLWMGYAAAPAAAQTVVIDPGHGGHDPGAVGCGLEEEDVVLDTSQRVANLLEGSGLNAEMTRADDRFIELANRSSFSDSVGAERFVSVHSNSNAGTPATGIETFHYTSASSTSQTLARNVQEELIAAWGLRDRGVKTGNFSVLRNTSAPAALTELGFTNNCSVDATYLGSETRRAEAANAIYRGIMRSLGRTPGDPVDPPVEPPPGPTRIVGVTFEDVGAGLEDTSRRITPATVTIAGTAMSTIVDGTGSFAFTLAPGTYTVQATADGWMPASRTCTLTTGDEWCSVGFTTRAVVEPPPVGTTGTAGGYLYEDKGTGDMSFRLPSVTVRVSGRTESVLTDASGEYRIDLPPGIYLLEMSAAGFRNGSRFCEVLAGTVASCPLGLVRDGSTDPIIPPPEEPSMPLPMASPGRLQGVIWVGDSRSIRVAGMSLRLIGFAPVTTSNPSGFWYFDIPAGTYTVEASGPGYSTASRTCQVVPSRETWCSFGVVSTTPPGMGGGDALPTYVDDRPEEAAAAEAPPPSYALGSSGCSTGGRGHAGWLALILAMLWVRRRSLLRLAPLALVVAAGCNDEDPVVAAEAAAVAAGESVEVRIDPSEIQLVDDRAIYARVERERVIANGDFIDVSLSPDGARVALSHPAFEGLSVLEVETARLQTIVQAPRSGFHPVWRADSQALGVRVRGQSSTAVPMDARDLSGASVGPVVANRELRAEVKDHRILLHFADGAEMEIGAPGDRYYAPVVSNDSRYVAFHGLSTGCYLFRVSDGTTFHLGRGTRSRFDPGSRWLVFERLRDDGHDYVEGDIYLTDLGDRALRTTRLDLEHDGIEHAPSITGNRIAFLRNGTAVVAELVTR